MYADSYDTNDIQAKYKRESMYKADNFPRYPFYRHICKTNEGTVKPFNLKGIRKIIHLMMSRFIAMKLALYDT